MKWEKLKEKIAKEVFTQIYQGMDFKVMSNILLDGMAANKPVSQESFKEYADKAYEIVMNWDIRAVERLRQTVGLFPKSLAKGKLLANMNKDGEWEINI